MLEKIGKGLLAGLGAVLLTKDKVEEVVRKMADEAKLSNEDARRLTNELVETGERQWEEMDKAVTESLRKSLAKMDVASRKEVEELKARLDNLEKRLNRLEQAGPGVTQPGA
jgi:polyhydroxyalkanoate synthesis regulator phasin